MDGKPLPQPEALTRSTPQFQRSQLRWGSHSSDTHHSMFQRHLLLEGSARGIALCTVAESEILNRDALVKHARGTFTHI